MFNKLFTAFRKDKTRQMEGGIYPPGRKLQSNQVPLRHAPLPDHFIIPLQQHQGSAGELQVKVGDNVLTGQPLTRVQGSRMVPIHAPTSGVVTAIQPHTTAHPSGLKALCIHITPDGKDQWCDRHPIADYPALGREQLLECLHQAGIAGLGGAGFSTVSKLQHGISGVETLILNAAECEPYITADDRLIQEHTDDVILGAQILIHLLKPKQVLIGIEDNKPEAIAALEKALVGQREIQLRVVPTKYPAGGAKQLTKLLTGREVPLGQHTSSIGVLVQNIGTVAAIKRAIIDGEPLIQRVVTLTGGALAHPGNFWVRIGTPVTHLLRLAGSQLQAPHKVIMGGPLMGFTLPALDVPIIKTSNCILVPSANEMELSGPEQACIRCGLCVEACPVGLLPQQLYWFSRGGAHEKARQHHLFDCIECGACTYVCPSNIPLVQYYQQEKADIRALDHAAVKAAEAKARFTAKQARMEREKRARAQRHQYTAEQPHARRRPIGDELMAQQPGINPSAGGDTPTAQSIAQSPDDPRKAAVAAAIARVKARKAAQIQQNTDQDAQQEQPIKGNNAGVAGDNLGV